CGVMLSGIVITSGGGGGGALTGSGAGACNSVNVADRVGVNFGGLTGSCGKDGPSSGSFTGNDSIFSMSPSSSSSICFVDCMVASFFLAMDSVPVLISQTPGARGLACLASAA